MKQKKLRSSFKSMDMTEIMSNKKSKGSSSVIKSKIINSKIKLPRQINNLDEESVHFNSSRSLVANNRENSNQTYQKYLKMLDPSFLNDGDTVSASNIVEHNNSFVPHKILKLLPLKKNEMSLKKFATTKFNLRDASYRVLTLNNSERNDQIDKSHSTILKNEELYTMFQFLYKSYFKSNLKSQK